MIRLRWVVFPVFGLVAALFAGLFAWRRYGGVGFEPGQLYCLAAVLWAYNAGLVLVDLVRSRGACLKEENFVHGAGFAAFWLLSVAGLVRLTIAVIFSAVFGGLL